uniref:Uncharacterized protein n=1 Tax=Graphocephala atropunctata TaxID=36148 RepID=A0A1B6KMD3_9HEMI
MALQQAYMLAATFILAISRKYSEAAIIQAAVDMGGDNSEFLQMVFKQIEKLGKPEENETTSLSKGHTELAAALLKVAPVVTIKGSVTDPARGLTVTFTVQASHHLPDSGEADADDDDKDDWEGRDWRGSGGVLHPIVGVVEPYVLGLAELVFNGILSSVIGNFLESTSLVGDVRLV